MCVLYSTVNVINFNVDLLLLQGVGQYSKSIKCVEDDMQKILKNVNELSGNGVSICTLRLSFRYLEVIKCTKCCFPVLALSLTLRTSFESENVLCLIILVGCSRQKSRFPLWRTQS